MILIGNFNSRTKEYSANQIDYNPKDLIKLDELGYIDLWKYYSIEDSDKYTWYHDTGTGFRIDYAFVSSKLAATLRDITSYQDRHIRESKISDQSP
jgi:exodeoxyribonuclease III